ncbi:MAG TPA: ribosomal RNA small subunit methyltransferase I [Candidatus Paceibacterota bacterium]|nr:ribosomal RNA small subunit methyltransferase I [Candidatus Paceibacterota bacterium]
MTNQKEKSIVSRDTQTLIGVLSIVATPIGNIEDITLRALRTLKECNVIYAEDTRVISKLLAKYEIKKPLQRLDAATEMNKAKEIIDRLEAGEHVAFVSDAGTPGISDPGARLVARVRAHSAGEVFFASGSQFGSKKTSPAPLIIETIPGPSALTAAISIAGIDEPSFTFLGFLPHKKGRQTMLKEIAASKHPVVVYESPHRVLKLLAELAAHGITQVHIGRELTKMHEEMLVGEPLDLAKRLEEKGGVRGEFVLIIGR